jgi:hypothetical protein
MLYFFSSVAHVWVPGAKTTGLIVKKFVFSSIVSENFKFQCDPFSNKKDISQKSITNLWGLSEMAYFIFLDIFQRNLAHL